MTAKLKTVPSTKKPKAEAKPKQELHPEVLQEAEKQVAAEVALPELTVYPGPEVKSAFEILPDGEVNSYPLSPEETISKAQGALDPDVPVPYSYPFKPQARWQGKVLEPVRRGRFMDMGFDEDPSGNLEWQIPEVLKDPSVECSEYIIDDNGRNLRVLMDDKSTFIGASFAHRPVGQNSLLVLINSSSLNDTAINNVLLAGIDSENGVYKDSTLSSYRRQNAPKGKMKFIPVPWGDNVVFENEYDNPNHKRLRVDSLWLKLSRVINSEIVSGTIISSNILDCRINGRGFRAKNAQMESVTALESANLDFTHCRLDNVTIYSSGWVTVSNTNIKDEYINVKGSINIDSKFADMPIPTVDGRFFRLTRQSEDKFVFMTGYTKEEIIDKKIGRYELEKIVIKALSYGDLAVYDLDSISKSIVDHMVDTILSRLKIISVLDSARKLTQSVYHDTVRDSYEDFFS